MCYNCRNSKVAGGVEQGPCPPKGHQREHADALRRISSGPGVLPIYKFRFHHEQLREPFLGLLPPTSGVHDKVLRVEGAPVPPAAQRRAIASVPAGHPRVVPGARRGVGGEHGGHHRPAHEVPRLRRAARRQGPDLPPRRRREEAVPRRQVRVPLLAIFQADAQRAGRGREHRPAPGYQPGGAGHLQVSRQEPQRQDKSAE